MISMIPRITFNNSTLNDVQGNYYNYHGITPGERGIHELFKASCPDAFHDSRARNPPPRCLDGTRVGILKEIRDRMAQANGQVLWLSGPAGAGKSAIAQTLAEACETNSMLAGSFFFFRGAPGRNTEECLIASIAYQVVMRIPEKRGQLGQIIEEDPSILHKSLHVQIRKLIIPLFVLESSNDTGAVDPPKFIQPPFVFIIDGLDECQGDNSQRDIVECMGEIVSAACVPLFCIIVSRPEPQIEESFGRLACMIDHISLANLCHIEQAENDIRTYLRRGFDQIYQDHNMCTDGFWPTEDDIAILVYKSKGLFIYASTILKYIEDRDFDPMERLREVMVPSLGSTIFADLDHLYRHIMGTHKNTELLLRILAVVCLWYGPPPQEAGSDGIETLLQLRKGAATTALRRMRSVFDIDQMTFYHKSFKDFIHDKKRAQNFFIDIKQAHASMAQMLLRHIIWHTEKDHLFWHAEMSWPWHCQESGHWDENPQILKEISAVLDYCERTGKKYLARHSFGVVGFLAWFEVNKIQPIDFEYSPLDIQYRLFKVTWRNIQSIFTFYEDSGLEGLMKRQIVRQGFDVLFDHMVTRHSHRPCWVLNKNRKLSLVEANKYFICTLGDSLAERRLQGAKRSDSVRFVDGHSKVVDRCLEVFSTDHWLDRAESEAAFSYARKYWTKHLSHVPPGSSTVLDSLEKYECSTFRDKLSMDDIQTAQTWLRSSGITPETSPEWAERGWFETPDIMKFFERDVQKRDGLEIDPQRNSFGLVATRCLKKFHTMNGRFTEFTSDMLFERNMQKAGTTDIFLRWESFGMAAAAL